MGRGWRGDFIKEIMRLGGSGGEGGVGEGEEGRGDIGEGGQGGFDQGNCVWVEGVSINISLPPPLAAPCLGKQRAKEAELKTKMAVREKVVREGRVATGVLGSDFVFWDACGRVAAGLLWWEGGRGSGGTGGDVCVRGGRT